MGWSSWRCVRWSIGVTDPTLKEEEPVTYELGLGPEPGDRGDPKPMYVGETEDAKERLSDYIHGHSHLEGEIKPKLDAGLALWWRTFPAKSKAEAKGAKTPSSSSSHIRGTRKVCR